MTGATGPVRNVRVAWHVGEDRRQRVTRVTLIEGYSTEADIPKILAARLTGDPTDGVVIVVDRIESL